MKVKKSYEGKRPRTWLPPSNKGRSAYDAYIAVLGSIARPTDAVG